MYQSKPLCLSQEIFTVFTELNLNILTKNNIGCLQIEQYFTSKLLSFILNVKSTTLLIRSCVCVGGLEVWMNWNLIYTLA